MHSLREHIVPEARLSLLLRQRTQDAHHHLDSRIMACEPFASRERYRRLVCVQARFFRMVAPCYRSPDLAGRLPDLPHRCRLDAALADLADLGLGPLTDDTLVRPDMNPAEQLGWLYVAEGSNLGAAILLKEAGKLGLSEDFGARHLAAPPEGRGLVWRRFQAMLDAQDLDETQLGAAVAGANMAFGTVERLVAESFRDNDHA